MTVELLFPAGPRRVAVKALLDEVTGSPAEGSLAVGDPRVIDFLGRLSRRLLTPELRRRYPELASLGYFLRPAELQRAVAALRSDHRGRHVPRGLAVHFAPSNVDTIFVYSWATSLLAGNPNIVRVSQRSGGAGSAILDALGSAVSEAHPSIGQTQRIVTYQRDEATTIALLNECMVRVLWGGDVSVTDLRRYPISPLARDIAFPDRSSFAMISLSGWFDASADQRAAAVDGFANDVYWFDQAACASPRALIWVGPSAAQVDARAEFDGLLDAAIARRGWRIDPAMAVEKRVATYGLAASGEALAVAFRGNAVADVELRALSDLPRTWLGAGTICHAHVDKLEDLSGAFVRRDQTLSHFGFSSDELDTLVRALGGRGIDRIVPFGRALSFSSIWDGMDLMREFTRLVTLS